MKLSCIFDKPPPGLRNTTWLQFPILGSAIRLQKARIRPFMTKTKLHEGIAAPEINFDTIDHIRRNTNQPTDVQELKGEQDKTQYARVVPESRSYFTVQPNFTDTLISFDKILENNQKLPVSDPRDAPKVAWLSGREYKNMIGEKIKNSRYQQMLQVLKRLNQIHPAVMPSEVEKALDTFKRDTVPEAASTKISPIDGFGRSLGVGRRKTSTARAWLVEGTGEVLVNGKTLSEAFGRIHDRETVIWPLKATMRVDKYNLWCRVEGGGTTGQAESLTLAVAKALLGHEPALKPALRRAGCITRDPRKVERKKPGHVKARKMPAWVKR
ncbi:putative ribosomal protein [Blumeria hordei DH14]|uniref:Small ribosomal subunit protein uS9m n=2 Tax=Blumeria hordei TaxID=2867405 RepID=N1JCP9_BLUG1|nr:putative ribosomal protein [Blumeria hordei DH14]